MSTKPTKQSDPSQEQLSTLLTIARSMGEVHELDFLIDLLAKESMRAVKSDRCSIFLLDTEKNELWSKVAIGEKERIRFPANLGIAGEIIQTGKPKIIDDAYQYPGFNKQIDEQTGYRTKSILVVPMSNVEGDIIGCVELINKIDGNFNESDCSFLQLLANHAAVSVESALMYEQKEVMIQDLRTTKMSLENKMRELEVVYGLEKNLSDTTNFQSVLTMIGSAICQFLKTSAVMFAYQEINKDPVVYTFKGNSLAIVPKENLIDSIKLRIKSGFNNNLLTKVVEEKVENHLGVPFHAVEQIDEEESLDVWGRVEVINHPEEFDDDELSFLNIIAEKVSSAIVRLRLLENRENSQRLATIGQLSSTIVHDFRSPMTSIRGFAELIKISGDTMDPKQREKLCSIIMSQVDRCTIMIEELLSFARGDKNYKLKNWNANSFFDEIIEILTVETEKNGIILESSVNFEGDLYIDKDKIMRVIFNLTNNALEILESGEKLILLVDVNDSGSIDIRIRDTGPGVPKELHNSLFEAFVTRGKATGTGLGLHIAKEIVEDHGGTITLEKTYKKGASFLIRIPLTQVEAIPA